jgi:hypothetical protein
MLILNIWQRHVDKKIYDKASLASLIGQSSATVCTGIMNGTSGISTLFGKMFICSTSTLLLEHPAILKILFTAVTELFILQSPKSLCPYYVILICEHVPVIVPHISINLMIFAHLLAPWKNTMDQRVDFIWVAESDSIVRYHFIETKDLPSLFVECCLMQQQMLSLKFWYSMFMFSVDMIFLSL